MIRSSPLLLSPVEEPESLTEPEMMDTGTLKRSDIQIAQPTSVLFPRDDPFDDSDGLSTPLFPYLPAPPGFTLIVWLGDIPWPAGSASPHDASQSLLGWYPLVFLCPD